MNFDYSKIITSNFRELIDYETYANLKKSGINERNYFLATCKTLKLKQYISSKASEIVSRHKYSSLNNVEKAIVAANIAYEDSKFSKVLKARGYSLEDLKDYIKLLNYIKVKKLSHKLTPTDTIYLKKAERFTAMLHQHLVIYFGATDMNIVVNKINEIISYYPELLEERTSSRSK